MQVGRPGSGSPACRRKVLRRTTLPGLVNPTVGLFRYRRIAESLREQLSTKQLGRLVRAIADRTHLGPFGAPMRVSRATLDRWIRDYRKGGFAALVATPRRVLPGTPLQVLEQAVALKTKAPDRTAAQVAVVLAARGKMPRQPGRCSGTSPRLA